MRRPGLGLLAACLSSVDSSATVSASSTAASGRGDRAGGIMPARSFTIIFSAFSACETASFTSNLARLRSAAGRRSLWQPAQYFAMTAL